MNSMDNKHQYQTFILICIVKNILLKKTKIIQSEGFFLGLAYYSTCSNKLVLVLDIQYYISDFDQFLNYINFEYQTERVSEHYTKMSNTMPPTARCYPAIHSVIRNNYLLWFNVSKLKDIKILYIFLGYARGQGSKFLF